MKVYRIGPDGGEMRGATHIIASDAGVTVLAAILEPPKAHSVSFLQVSD